MSANVLIVGDGVIGLGCAFRLLTRGHRVTVLGDGAMRASAAAAGMLAPSFERHHPRAGSALAPLLEASLELWDGFADELAPAAPDGGLGYDRAGIVGLGFTDRPEGARDCPVPEGFKVPGGKRSAFVIEGEGQVDPRRLLLALGAAVDRAGGRRIAGRAERLVTAPHYAEARLGGGDETWRGDAVVLAGGGGRVPLHEAIAPLPTVRGRAFLLASETLTLRRVVRTPAAYFCPKADGLYLGATEETVEGDGTAPEHLRHVATQYLPALRSMAVTARFDGYRPTTADGLPEIGPAEGEGRIILARGHDRNGVLLTPLTANRVAHHLDVL